MPSNDSNARSGGGESEIERIARLASEIGRRQREIGEADEADQEQTKQETLTDHGRD